MVSYKERPDSALRVRVETVERDVGHIEQQIGSIRDTMATRGDIGSIMLRLENMAVQQVALAKPNYNLMVSIVGVAMVFITMIGGFAYWPINTATADLKAAVIALSEKTVPQRQYDADAVLDRSEKAQLRTDLSAVTSTTIQQQRYNLDAAKLEAELAAIRQNGLTRSEFALVANERAAALAGFQARIDRLESLEFKK